MLRLLSGFLFSIIIFTPLVITLTSICLANQPLPVESKRDINSKKLLLIWNITRLRFLKITTCISAKVNTNWNNFRFFSADRSLATHVKGSLFICPFKSRKLVGPYSAPYSYQIIDCTILPTCEFNCSISYCSSEYFCARNLNYF